MRNKVAKKLRRIAEIVTVGMPLYVTDKKYKEMKTSYKRKHGKLEATKNPE